MRITITRKQTVTYRIELIVTEERGQHLWLKATDRELAELLPCEDQHIIATDLSEIQVQKVLGS